jgi:hypothetical protein
MTAILTVTLVDIYYWKIYFGGAADAKSRPAD